LSTERAVLAVDTGGTFTDLVWWEEGAVRVEKVLSTPDDPARAIKTGLTRLRAHSSLPAEALAQVLHGTTVATNAVLERRGARTALVTNRGFEDLLVIGRQSRPELYALEVRRSDPLVAPGDAHGVGGRLGPDGTEWAPLDEADLAALCQVLADDDGVRSVALCLLHSYANGAHEERVAEALARARPDLEISVSSRLLPRFRELERTAATVLNAYVQPTMRRYLARLEERLATPLLVMQSDGGMVSATEASRRPVQTLLSGPAGGVVGAWAAGRSAGLDKLISFDMGGTSTDVSLIDGAPALTSESTVAGLPLAITTVAIHTVGAGGGSIARVDAAGALKVGPESAGADPGPACYGRGARPTVTDAHVVLGRLPEDAFLGGEMRLDRPRAEAAIERLAHELQLSREEAAQGVIAVANAHMVRALKVISLERGFDPRGFCLVAFGGAGGLHAAELAEALGMTRVLLPADPGLLSAVGILQADLTRELLRNVLEPLAPGSDPAPERVAELRAPLEAEARAFFEAHGVAEADREVTLVFECRYEGQSFELAVGAEDGRGVAEAFAALHEQRYGYRLDRPLEWVALRLRACGRRWRGRSLDFEAREKPRPSSAEVWPWPVEARGGLVPGESRTGPLVVTEYSATTWVPEGWSLEVLPDGALLLERSAP
jgi:N-methylhydantoinase A